MNQDRQYAPSHEPRSARRRASAIACLALLLSLGGSHVLAQLPVGGTLGPDLIEEAVEEAVEDNVGDAVEDLIEEEVAATVEQATEQNIQENIEDNIEEAIEQTVDATVEDTIDDVVTTAVEAVLESTVEASVTAALEADVETAVEESVAAAVEENVEAAVEESVAAAVEENVEAGVEETVADAVEASVEAGLEDQVAAAVESSVESSVEASVAEALEESVEASVAQAVEESVEAGVETAVEEDVQSRIVAAIEERVEYEIDEIVDALEGDLEVDEHRILTSQWLVMAEPAVFPELTEQGYLFETVTELPGLGLRLAEVAAPSTFDISEVRSGVIDVVGQDRAEVDLNHIYTAGAPESAKGAGVLPRAAMPMPTQIDETDLRVGMIDSEVDTSHPALSRARIHSRSFARKGAETPSFHGTAIASIIAGKADDFVGLAPGAELYAASVFELDRDRSEIASTVSLIRALDWLISSEVDVVNVSLAGPPNRLLERALDRAASQGVVVMAAAGNGGPMARPMYPAAYDSVVAVTAVDATRRVFRLANRGDYLALAAPGVDLRHAAPGGGYTASSGTSFAVPFAVTAAAHLSRLQPGADIITTLLQSALDIGPPGRDDIYGYGLLTLGSL